jgi:hypothetical protein
MKKLLLLAALAVCTCHAFAQVSLIPKAGVTFANATYEGHILGIDNASLRGLTGGLGINFSLTKNNFLSIQPEILYAQKGCYTPNNAIATYDFSFRLNYLEVPLLLKANFGGQKMKFYVNAGPSIGYLLNGSIKGRGNSRGYLNPEYDFEEPIQLTDDPQSFLDVTRLYANRIEAGLNFGGGVGYHFFGSTALFVDLRYNMGLTDFNKQYPSRNRVFALTAGVQVPLGK